MDNTLLENFIGLILSQTGILIRSTDRQELEKKLITRAETLRLKYLQYYELLANTISLKSNAEWKILASLVTTGESYFFRDEGQMQLLKECLLPKIIWRAQNVINILSAGCSTGEEVYSLAIILHELIPDFTSWQINLIGVDLNQEAIGKAKRGFYQEWSFRGVDSQIRSQYFKQNTLGWQVIPTLHKKVSFYCANLIQDDLRVIINQPLDLILCRNVFIYFDPEKIALVIAKFINLLRPGGYLLTGHTEIQRQNIAPLQILNFTESLVYQLPDRQPETFPEKVTNIPNPNIVAQDILKRAQNAFQLNEYTEVIKLIEEQLPTDRYDREAIYLLAQAYGNQGNYVASIKLCKRILAIDPGCHLVLSLLAKIAEDQGNMQQAKEYLRRLIFFHPNFIAAYVELMALHVNDWEKEEANSLLRITKIRLAHLQENDSIPYTENMTVSALYPYLEHLEQILKDNRHLTLKVLSPISVL